MVAARGSRGRRTGEPPLAPAGPAAQQQRAEQTRASCRRYAVRDPPAPRRRHVQDVDVSDRLTMSESSWVVGDAQPPMRSDPVDSRRRVESSVAFAGRRVMGGQAAEVTVYTLTGCLHCERARRRLRRDGADFEEIRGNGDPGFRARLLELTGGFTVPQIVIDGEAVGGADELAALDRRGVLAPRLALQRFPHPVVRRRLAVGRSPGFLEAASSAAAVRRGAGRPSFARRMALSCYIPATWPMRTTRVASQPS